VLGFHVLHLSTPTTSLHPKVRGSRGRDGHDGSIQMETLALVRYPRASFTSDVAVTMGCLWLAPCELPGLLARSPIPTGRSRSEPERRRRRFCVTYRPESRLLALRLRHSFEWSEPSAESRCDPNAFFVDSTVRSVIVPH
jgi:hypothetical protein